MTVQFRRPTAAQLLIIPLPAVPHPPLSYYPTSIGLIPLNIGIITAEGFLAFHSRIG